MRLILYFTAAEAGALAAVVTGHLWLAAIVIVLGSQAAVRHDSGYRR